jgi:predicted Fe-Mo cluster-binding NifX family protein
MRVCVACQFPGGPEAEIVYSLEESELFDCYEVHDDGRYELTAQTRRCACSDLVEPIIRRGVEAVVVKGLAPNSLLALGNAGIRVFLTESQSAKAALDVLTEGRLREVGLRDFSTIGRKRD